MNRLTYPQKLLLISVLFLLPLGVGLTMLISTLNSDIAFVRKELAGTTYLRPLRTLLAHTIEEQLLAERYFSGETDLEPLVLAQHEQLKADLAALSLIDARLGAAMRTSVQYKTLLNEWQRLDAQFLLRSVTDTSAAYGRFITTIRDLMNRVGDQSNLILDPSIESYYLMDTLLMELPESLNLLSQTAGMVEPIVTRQALIDGEENRLTVLYGLVEANASRLDHNLKTVFNEDPSQTLRPALSRPAQDFNQAATTLLASIDSGILKPEQVIVASADVRTQIESSLSTSLALWDQSVGELDRLLLARIVRFSLQRLIVLVLSGLVVLITVYLLVGFYLGVMRTVGTFQQVTASMISGDFSRQVRVGTRDELGQVASSFNAIATALVESSVQRQAIVEHAIHAILTFDRHGIIASLNPAAAQVFGSGDLRGQLITAFLVSDLAALQIVSTIRELAGRRHDGAAFAAEVAIGQAQDQDNPVWIAFVRDISVRKQAESERNRLQDALKESHDTLEQQVVLRTSDLAQAKTEADAARLSAEEANALKTTFLANMSHELRTPLNAIINYSHFLKNPVDSDDPETRTLYLDRVLVNAEHLLGLINDILDLSKIEAGHVELIREEIDVAALLQGVHATGLGLTKDKPIELILDIDARIPPLMLDKTRIRQVLLNLVSNAAKFTEAGAIAIRARLASPGALEIAVSDTGVGIAPEHHARVFEEFQQVQNELTRAYEGTGLGLAISKRLVEMHGGEIRLESTAGQGSTFTVILPAIRPEPASPLAAPKAASGLAPVIMTVDNDPDAQRVLQRILEPAGYLVLPVLDSRQVLPALTQHVPDLIILDVLMPHIDGWTLLERIRAEPALAATPVIICSISDAGEHAVWGALGIADYLVKPVSSEGVLRAVQRWITPSAAVVVIDDDPDVRRTTALSLERAQIPVHQAESGTAGLDLIRRERPGVIILDLMMPEMDGFLVIEELRGDPALAAIPVIVVTAKDLTAEERQWLQARTVACVQKAVVTSEGIRALVDTFLRQKAR